MVKTFPELEQLNTPHGRFYKTPDGIYPSVTTVLGSQDSTWIDEWRAKVGVAEAELTSRRATRRGTRIHKYAEDYFDGKQIEYASIMDKVLFTSLYPVLDDITNVVLQEQRMYSNILRSAGTVDLVAKYQNILSVIDWKTSTRQKYHSDIHDYFCQSAAYACMYWEMTGVPIRNIVIVIAVDADRPQVFVEKVDKWISLYKDIRNNYKGIYQ